jgi:hypothetical protein
VGKSKKRRRLLPTIIHQDCVPDFARLGAVRAEVTRRVRGTLGRAEPATAIAATDTFPYCRLTAWGLGREAVGALFGTYTRGADQYNLYSGRR